MKRLLSLIVVGMIFGSVYAQDVHFSQFFQTPTLLNPALSGIYEGTSRLSLGYKGQWSSIDNAYQTIHASAETTIFKQRKRMGSASNFLAMGLDFFQDKAGDLAVTTDQVLLSVAYNLEVAVGHRLAGGIHAGFGTTKLDPSSGKWGSQYDETMGIYDPSLPSGEMPSENSKFYPDFGIGLAHTWNADWRNPLRGWGSTTGLSVSHLNRPNKSPYTGGEDKLHIKYTLQSKFNIPVDKKIYMIPQMLFSLQGPSYEWIIGSDVRYFFKSYANYTAFYKDMAGTFGLHWRTGDAIIATVGFTYDSFNIGLSYDVNVSELSLASRYNGGIEAHLSYQFKGDVYKRMQNTKSYY